MENINISNGRILCSVDFQEYWAKKITQTPSTFNFDINPGYPNYWKFWTWKCKKLKPMISRLGSVDETIINSNYPSVKSKDVWFISTKWEERQIMFWPREKPLSIKKSSAWVKSQFLTGQSHLKTETSSDLKTKIRTSCLLLIIKNYVKRKKIERHLPGYYSWTSFECTDDYEKNIKWSFQLMKATVLTESSILYSFSSSSIHSSDVYEQ